jgi:hypothetical protein
MSLTKLSLAGDGKIGNFFTVYMYVRELYRSNIEKGYYYRGKSIIYS